MVVEQKNVNLALQGGGSHGAFTWGVLDKLLEDGRINFSGISGTSAGAINAVLYADGMKKNGKEGAREAMHNFWHKLSMAANWSPIKRNAYNVMTGNWSVDTSVGFLFYTALTRFLSPYQLNPLNFNPIKDILDECIDFERVRCCDKTQLFISATNVETGLVRVFESHELTSEMVIASCCLPQVFQAVEIDGIPYWDGGYMGNPVLFPFFDHTDCADILVVQINPIERKGTPKTPQAISDRINEIGFNSSLLKDLRSVAFVSKLIQRGVLSADEYRDNHIHIIANQEALKPLGVSSKMNLEWSFLLHLRDIGRATAEKWLAENFTHVGEKSSVDIAAMFQGTRVKAPE